MNILVIGHYGLYEHLSASFIHSQVKEYAALGHRVKVIIPVPLGKVRDERRLGPALAVRQADGVELYYLRFLSLSNYGKKRFNTSCAIAAMKLQLGKILGDFKPDVVHAHTLGLDSGIGAWLKARFGCPLVITTHGSDTFVPLKNGEGTLLKEYADKGDTLVCVSNLLRSKLLECGVSTPMEIILNGFAVKPAEVVPEKTPFTMIQAGYLVERKRADLTIRAFEILKKKYPQMRLKIVGSGAELKRYQALTRELNVEDAVEFTGYLSNPEAQAQMAQSMYFVMPSEREGFGIVYLEAMANRCITIGTEGEGIADFIVSGENGFLVPHNSPEAIAEVIDHCIQNPEEAAAIADRGYEAAIGLTWKKNAQQYLSLFSGLLETKSAE